jgi:hypothetical protein
MLKAQSSIALTAAILVAALIGIQLGRSAVGAIDPIFYSERQPHPRDRGAAIDPREIEARRLARQAALYDRYYDWDHGAAALSEARGDVAPTASFASPVPYFGSREEIAADDARMLLEIEERDRARAAAAERRALLQRAVLEVPEIPVEPLREPETQPPEEPAQPPDVTD